MVAQYTTDANLAARQRLWQVSRREPDVPLFPWVLALADVHPGERVVEVGCGNGRYLGLLPGAVGVDLSPGMLHAARAHAPSAPLACGDAPRLPLATAAFDVVLAPHMLYHVPDRVAAARELRRITRPGGRCIAVTNGETNHAQMVQLVEDVVGRSWSWIRSAVAGFSLENGAEQLRVGFESVERVDTPKATTHVTDAEALEAYLLSMGDLYEASSGASWSEVAAECGRRAAAIIERDGSFPIDGSVGAFVCR
jgi:SAM-dependent methyltransferase